MLETNIHIKTDRFDGPLGLLLLLIQKEEMQIRDLDLTVITKQYLAYLKRMQDINFDIAGDYLYLAATLLLLKSKSCISEEDLTDVLDGDIISEGGLILTKADLVRRLEALQRFQTLGQALWSLPKKGHDIFVKPKVNRKAIIDSVLTPMNLDELTNSMIDFLRREKRKIAIVKRDRLSIKEKLQFMKEFLQQGQKTSLHELLSQDKTGIEKTGEIGNIVITFISLLELARLKKVQVFQSEYMGDIYVDVVDSLDNFNVDLANGFESDDPIEKSEEIVEPKSVDMDSVEPVTSTVQ